jgi:hypothetical protein
MDQIRNEQIPQKYPALQLLLDGAEYLQACGVAEPRAEADILLAHILGISRDKLYLERTLEFRMAIKEKYRGS